MKRTIQEEIEHLQARVIILSNGKNTLLIVDGEDKTRYCQRINFTHDVKKGNAELETDYSQTIRTQLENKTASAPTEAEYNQNLSKYSSMEPPNTSCLNDK